MEFEWDSEKAVSNLARHGVAFEEATSVFGDPLATTVSDPDHSTGEERFLTTGLSDRQRVVIVWHADQGDVVRIIGARQATPHERRTYESGQ
ncbi:MAG: BrnT family toxin [Candidatus Rokubacteria bacterium]|nr:BrnT family toxin [Candidatus Rokubacteria bacterium]